MAHTWSMGRNIGPGSLGEFLTALRSRLTPEDIGLTMVHGTRRVSGLRREEIAMLAGVSPSYYTRLEQGQALNASVQVLDALAQSLRLNDAETAHLHELARARTTAMSYEPVAEELLNPELGELLHNFGDIPALILGRRRDILGWNPLGHALFAGHLDFNSPADLRNRPNATKLVFLDQHTRELYVDWEEKASASVGHLRLLAAGQGNDRALLELIGSLTAQSADFSRIWSLNRIRTTATARYRMNHPVVGAVDVTQQLLAVPGIAGYTVVICTTKPGSSSDSALRLLAQVVHEATESGSRIQAMGNHPK